VISPEEVAFLWRALPPAERGGRATAPNPRVGAIVVRDGVTVGEGSHRVCGGPHAEALALDEAGAAAQGATLFSSLEPCPHHGRQPPCVGRIAGAGIRRVVVGRVDPDPRVSGAGIEALRAAGIEVEIADGELGRQATQLVEDYLVHRIEGRSFAALKVAATLDGRLADRQGASRWITGESARSAGRSLRARYGAILIGAGTVRADDPLLLPAEGDDGPFRRCVVDGRLTIDPGARLLREGTDRAPVLVYTSPSAAASRRRALEATGAEVVPLGPESGPVPPRAILEDLARRGILGVLVEGGGVTHGHFFEAGLIDKLYWFLAPRLLGDPGARPAFAGPPRRLADAGQARFAAVERLGEDLLLTLYPGATTACSPDS